MQRAADDDCDVFEMASEKEGLSTQPLEKRQRLHNTEWWLYPTKDPYRYCVGDKVLVKPLSGTTKHYKNGRIVRLESGNAEVEVEGETVKLGMQELKRLVIPHLGLKDTVLVTPETNFFRHLAAYVKPSDVVLEIGCSSGETSRLLATLCNSWVGFDTSKKMLRLCEESITKHPPTAKTHYVLVDALVDPRRASKEARVLGEPTVFFMDIGGNREYMGVMRMLTWVLGEFEAKLVVIKSRELVHAISGSCDVDCATGIVKDGQKWFSSRQQNRVLPKHPLKAPLVMSPTDPEKPICRYHNYHKKGCAKATTGCPLDHEHCHFCLRKGHIARNCKGYSACD